MVAISQLLAAIPNVTFVSPNILQSHDQTLLKRATFDDTCTSDQKATIGLAASNCRTLAQHGADAARNDQEKVLLYFKTSNPRSIQTIVQTFDKVYDECNVSGGENTITCYDDWNACSERTLAHTIRHKKKITICPLFFTLPEIASYYGERSQANVMLHEVTHLRSGKKLYSTFGV
ncbi:uncharacterized protein PgNI_08773 [Pyricularia grisea]|uniref:Lysine-specific metallo-endopeptidase domain-containing protein n=1 Tax=Pyricularia grisea TaxID=148305 RepID=A0A6P8AUV3_PYRGI|nr:uncharacterized protein PgNI_08773 [Pyricularia grisea]TLD05939.1 hypothetical protein PgNI_08773 [Pyricularia grisea]